MELFLVDPKTSTVCATSFITGNYREIALALNTDYLHPAFGIVKDCFLYSGMKRFLEHDESCGVFRVGAGKIRIYGPAVLVRNNNGKSSEPEISLEEFKKLILWGSGVKKTTVSRKKQWKTNSINRRRRILANGGKSILLLLEKNYVDKLNALVSDHKKHNPKASMTGWVRTMIDLEYSRHKENNNDE